MLQSLDSEATSLLHSACHLIQHLVIGLIRRYVYSIKTVKQRADKSHISNPRTTGIR